MKPHSKKSFNQQVNLSSQTKPKLFYKSQHLHSEPLRDRTFFKPPFNCQIIKTLLLCPAKAIFQPMRNTKSRVFTWWNQQGSMNDTENRKQQNWSAMEIVAKTWIDHRCIVARISCSLREVFTFWLSTTTNEFYLKKSASLLYTTRANALHLWADLVLLHFQC